MDFTSVFAPISSQLEEFESELKRVLETDSPIIRRITDHLYGSSGKRLRPALLFLASDWASFITGEILNVNGGAVLAG